MRQLENERQIENEKQREQQDEEQQEEDEDEQDEDEDEEQFGDDQEEEFEQDQEQEEQENYQEETNIIFTVPTGIIGQINKTSSSIGMLSESSKPSSITAVGELTNKLGVGIGEGGIGGGKKGGILGLGQTSAMDREIKLEREAFRRKQQRRLNKARKKQYYNTEEDSESSKDEEQDDMRETMMDTVVYGVDQSKLTKTTNLFSFFGGTNMNIIDKIKGNVSVLAQRVYFEGPEKAQQERFQAAEEKKRQALHRQKGMVISGIKGMQKKLLKLSNPPYKNHAIKMSERGKKQFFDEQDAKEGLVSGITNNAKHQGTIKDRFGMDERGVALLRLNSVILGLLTDLLLLGQRIRLAFHSWESMISGRSAIQILIALWWREEERLHISGEINKKNPNRHSILPPTKMQIKQYTKQMLTDEISERIPSPEGGWTKYEEQCGSGVYFIY
ncbi:MAG: hypothetical protein EZS28_022202 [Streblomastix strix]|uniref:Uncharacterized protein n=1 Tax=Streblomastix strix TaxID=222440 RepID=A0A5J4VI49_9EUKA|nr:MAG: hypothetical protein EZS28_022202 [Streblomastix strix]